MTPTKRQFNSKPKTVEAKVLKRKDVTDELLLIWVKRPEGLSFKAGQYCTIGIGGIERADGTGNISYDAENHQRMTKLRAAKIDGIANDIPPQVVEQGKDRGKLAVVGWGSTYGPISRAVGNMRDMGYDVSHVHVRHIWPLPRNLGDDQW